MYPAPLYLALVHYPVLNNGGTVVTTSVTTFDIHDGARMGRVFGAKKVYYVTPVPEQQGLVHYFKDYWTEGPGGKRHANRREALLRVDCAPSLPETKAAIAAIEGKTPYTVATSAKRREDCENWAIAEFARHWKAEPSPLLLVFGTGWGLADSAFPDCDAVFPPITGPDAYNHLPVRAAIAITLDRLWTTVS